MSGAAKPIPGSARPEGVLENVITFICFYVHSQGYSLSMTKLMKLVYLVEVYHTLLTRERIINVPFYRWNYGAYSPSVIGSLESLFSKGILAEKVVKTQDGNLASLPVPKISKTRISLTDSAREAVKSVLEDWADKDLEEIVRYTKKTLPFLNTAFGEKIDFSRIDPVVEYAKEKGVSEAEAATRDIASNKPLIKSLRQADKELREGESLLNWDEVFG